LFLNNLCLYIFFALQRAGYQAISSIRPDIWQVKSGIRPDTGYQKGRIIRPDIWPAGYPVHP
jgi:hypothetical protein